MKKEPLVSIITPCYNGAKYLPKFLNSLLNQDYLNIEFIFVNDGSTDETEELFFKFKPKLENKGWKVLYFKQQNSGAAGALNTGLKYFTGKYLTWPDSDDILFSNYISKKVEYMEKHNDCGLLFSVTEELNIDNPNSTKKYVRCNKYLLNESNIFENMIFHKNTTVVDLCTFVRSENFLKINPNREIYKSMYGQNFQMLLPMVYNFKVGFIDDVLAYYVIHKDSNSKDKNKTYERFLSHEDILFNTLNGIKMPMLKRIKLKIKIKIYFYKKKFRYKFKNLIIYFFGEKFLNFIRKIKNCNKK